MTSLLGLTVDIPVPELPELDTGTWWWVGSVDYALFTWLIAGPLLARWWHREYARYLHDHRHQLAWKDESRLNTAKEVEPGLIATAAPISVPLVLLVQALKHVVLRLVVNLIVKRIGNFIFDRQ